MLKQRREKQQQMELVIMEQMVPENHFLRKVDRAVDFSFIYDLCAPLYCADNGRPAIDPEMLFRMLLVGYLYGIKSEARLEEEINYNIAYKWFCGLDLTDKVPDATTIKYKRAVHIDTLCRIMGYKSADEINIDECRMAGYVPWFCLDIPA